MKNNHKKKGMQNEHGIKKKKSCERHHYWIEFNNIKILKVITMPSIAPTIKLGKGNLHEGVPKTPMRGTL
jgi:hypothetical protein